jgi:hypothetical protein
MASSRRPSHAWAHHTEVAQINPEQLSDAAAAGLEYAADLAYDAQERRRRALRHEPLDPPLTIADLAARTDLPTATVEAMINHARCELFGNLSDAGIYKRRQRQQTSNSCRACQQHGCTNKLPQTAPRHRHYCTKHRTAKARKRRSRANTHQQQQHN